MHMWIQPSANCERSFESDQKIIIFPFVYILFFCFKLKQSYVVDYMEPSKFKQLTKSGFTNSVSINQVSHFVSSQNMFNNLGLFIW